MSNTLKTFFTTLGTTGVFATGGLIYTHHKTLSVNKENKQKSLDLARQRLELDRETLELEKYKQNIPSIYDTTQPPLPAPATTPVTDFLNSKIETTSLDNTSQAAILHIPTPDELQAEPVQLAGLALLCFTTGIVACLLILFLINYKQNKDFRSILKKFPSLERPLEYYRIYLRISNIYTLCWLLFFIFAQLFVSLYLLIIFKC